MQMTLDDQNAFVATPRDQKLKAINIFVAEHAIALLAPFWRAQLRSTYFGDIDITCDALMTTLLLYSSHNVAITHKHARLRV